MKKVSLILIIPLLLFICIFIQGSSGCTSQKEVNMPIVLLTDYGNDDYRVAQLKGIIYTNNPEAKVIDGSHGIPAFDIYAGAFVLDIAAKEFPEGVVFIGIVAPYDQTETRYLVLTTTRNQIFVLHDNGLLTYVIDDIDNDTIYQVTAQDLFDKPIEELNAEPIQGKIGSIISSGYPPENVGVLLASPRTLEIYEPVIVGDTLLGTVVYIDHYGNCITNISRDITNEFDLNAGDMIKIKGPDSTIIATFGTIY